MVRNKQNSGKRSFCFYYLARRTRSALVLFDFDFALPRRSPIIERGLGHCIACLKSGAHFLNLRRLFPYTGHESLNLLLLLRDCRFQFCDRLFLHFAGHESRGRPENPFEKARKRIATLGADRRDFDQHIVGQAVAVRIDG